jgi:hypothetical protein
MARRVPAETMRECALAEATFVALVICGYQTVAT